MNQRNMPGVSGGAWTAVTIVVAITFLSTFTLGEPEGTVAERQATGQGFTDPETGQGAGVDPNAATGDAGDADPRTVQRQVAVGGEEGTEGQEGVADGARQGGQGETRGYDCARGENAGATDDGVKADEIRVAATVVKTGIAKDFLGDAQFGIEAVRQKVNRQGGICGRELKITYEDDGWEAGRGKNAIEKWVREKNHFGLVVNPSSEGLRGAIRSGLIDAQGFPVVGADGMLIGQYREDWVWPVATSTHSVMHIMARDAYERGARSFGIVWETNFRFGVEGQNAFVGAIERLCGSDCIPDGADKGIKGGELGYANDANSFVDACSDESGDFEKCDFIAVLLEPATAAQWVADNGLGGGNADQRPRMGIGAPQPLFVDSFIRNCGAPCSNMWVWTSFKPPLDPFRNDPAVVGYVDDLRAVSSAADAANPHVQGAYVGASLLVEALEQLGPAPTRAGIRQALDAMTFDSGLAPPLAFRPGNHFAAISAQAYQAIFNGNNFTGWRYTKSGFIEDRDVEKDQLKDA